MSRYCIGWWKITVVVRLSGGVHATIHPPFSILKNGFRYYLIKGSPESVPSVCYRSSSKGWMDSTVWKKHLDNHRAIEVVSNGHHCVLFVNNCSSNLVENECEKALNGRQTLIRKFPPNDTDLIQPTDSFVIKNKTRVEEKMRCLKVKWCDWGKWVRWRE